MPFWVALSVISLINYSNNYLLVFSELINKNHKYRAEKSKLNRG